MVFSEITIRDKELFDKYLVLYNPSASEFTFTNFFMWREYYNFRYTIAHGFLCVIAEPPGQAPYALMPFGKIEEDNFRGTVEYLKEYFSQKGWKLLFQKVAEQDLVHFGSIVKAGCDIVYDRDNSDYLYLTDDLINLRGKKFHTKRNHINKFNRLYEYEYVPMQEEHVEECLRIMNDWCKSRDCDCHKGEYCERYANEEVLNNYSVLGLKGALIKVDGVFEAFTVGEMLNSDTAVIHIEKANFMIDGLYALINQQFCKNEWEHTTYINREQDIGQEGLRKAKLSYNPVMMVKKYTICI